VRVVQQSWANRVNIRRFETCICLQHQWRSCDDADTPKRRLITPLTHDWPTQPDLHSVALKSLNHLKIYQRQDFEKKNPVINIRAIVSSQKKNWLQKAGRTTWKQNTDRPSISEFIATYRSITLTTRATESTIMVHFPAHVIYSLRISINYTGQYLYTLLFHAPLKRHQRIHRQPAA
jgi:hypothetical protein